MESSKQSQKRKVLVANLRNVKKRKMMARFVRNAELMKAQTGKVIEGGFGQFNRAG